MKAPLSLIALAVALASCGQSAPHAGSSGGAARQPAPAASASAPSRPLIAVSDEAGAGRTALSLVTLDGLQVGHVIVQASDYPWPGVGGGMLTFVDQGQLKGLTRSGSVETLGSVAGYTAGPVVVSPDGQHWMWGTFSSGSDGTVTSKLMLGSRSSLDRVIEKQTSQQRHLAPYRWTGAGPTYEDAALGIGGYIPFFGATGPSSRFDVDSGKVTTVLGGTSCQFADLAQDLTIACFGADNVLDVLSANGHIVEVSLPKPTFTFHGAVSFAPGPTATTLVVGGGTGDGANGKPERDQTDVLDISSRTLRQLGPDGLRPADGPAAWLPDGSLLAYRPAGAFGGDPGVYVVARDGSAKKILSSGTALGVITG